MKKKYIILIIIILIIIVGIFFYKIIAGNNIKNKTYDFLEEKGYTRKDIEDIEIKHSFINKILSYNEWRIFVEFEREEDIIFAFTYRNKKIVKQGIKSDEYQLTKEEINEYDRRYENGELKYNKEVKITLADINDKITNYYSRENNDVDNLSHYYIDEKNNKVVVGLAGNTKEEQDRFINNVFSECCGSKYIKYIKDNSLIEFVEAKYTFDAKIVEVKDDEIVVSVLKDTKEFNIDDKIRIKITRPTNGINDFYMVGNNVKVTAKGMILTSNPAQIDVISVELIS